jgi:hypothetical protein
MRASDADRERVLAMLRDAHSEGRLDLDDFYQRLDVVYQAKTYGELAVITRDLPPTVSRPATRPRQDLHTPPPAPPRPAAMPRYLRAMWLLWLAVVSINVLIWLMVAVGTGSLPYFWPFWVAGPWGAVLASFTLVWYAGNRGHDDGSPPQIPRG